MSVMKLFKGGLSKELLTPCTKIKWDEWIAVCDGIVMFSECSNVHARDKFRNIHEVDKQTRLHRISEIPAVDEWDEHGIQRRNIHC
jgi:hypothetical protein